MLRKYIKLILIYLFFNKTYDIIKNFDLNVSSSNMKRIFIIKVCWYTFCYVFEKSDD